MELWKSLGIVGVRIVQFGITRYPRFIRRGKFEIECAWKPAVLQLQLYRDYMQSVFFLVIGLIKTLRVAVFMNRLILSQTHHSLPPFHY